MTFWVFACPKCGWAGKGQGRKRCLPCYAQAMRQWRKDNPEKSREQKRRYEYKIRKFRPDKYAQKLARPRNPETVTAYRARRRVWYQQGDVTREQLEAIVTRDGGRCVYCQTLVKTNCYPHNPRGFDHIVGREAGGRHTASNLCCCCVKCNRARTPSMDRIRKRGAPCPER